MVKICSLFHHKDDSTQDTNECGGNGKRWDVLPSVERSWHPQELFGQVISVA